MTRPLATRREIFATCLVALAVIGVSCGTANAVVLLTGSPYSQSFDTLSSVNSAANIPWANDTTIVGWHLFRQPAPGTAIPTYVARDGSSNTGSFYGFGVAGVNPITDRALGGIASGGAYFGSPLAGAVAGWMAASFQNNTGFLIDSFTVGYTGEEWRTGGVASGTVGSLAQTMVLEYGFGPTFQTVGTWTAPGPGFNFTSPIFGTVAAAALDGNDPLNRQTGRGGTVSNLLWANGTNLWIRWIENNDPNNDHGLAIDDFSIRTTRAAIPLPSAALIYIGVAGAAGVTRRRIKKMLA
jgi:hypothetical protein